MSDGEKSLELTNPEVPDFWLLQFLWRKTEGCQLLILPNEDAT